MNINQFIHELVSGNETAEHQLQEFAGYCLLNDCRFQRAVVLYGNGLGKTTYGKILKLHVVGPELTLNLPIKDYRDKLTAGRLSYGLLNVIHGTFDDLCDPPHMAKRLICGEPMVVTRKHQDHFIITSPCKHLLITHIIPDHGNRRLITVSCQNQPAKIIPNLAVDMDPREVMGWARLGMARLLRNGKFTGK